MEQQQGTVEHGTSSAHDVTPAIWVCSVKDYHRGLLYGSWIDAAREPEDMARDVEQLLLTSPTPGPTDTAIFSQRGFHGLRFRHDESLTVVSRLGRGVAEYGEPFAASLWRPLPGTN